MALRELAGHVTEQNQATPKTKAASTAKPKGPAKKAKPVEQKTQDQVVDQAVSSPPLRPQKGDIALTVRIEINLPAEGTQETYDAIFKSIKANLYP